MPKIVEIEDLQHSENESFLNANIENFLLNAQFLEIDQEFGLLQLNAYLEDLVFLQSGGQYKHLGISQRRKESRPQIITCSLIENSATIVDGFDLFWEGDKIPENSIALLKLRGVMRAQSGISSPGVDSMANDLRIAYQNKNIAGVIIETNSGGGESIAGTMLKSAISERNKPVIGFAHLAASAAYRALSGADEIIASSPYSEFGSIGTMIQMDMKMLKKYRKSIMDFYGVDAPEKNADFRSAKEGDFQKIQNRVDELTKQFHEDIKKSRNLIGDNPTIKDTLSGKIFNALEGKKRGLVDAIGNLNFAVKRIYSLKKN